MNAGESTLAQSLLLAYQEGYSVADLCTLTGMEERHVVLRLCMASRHLAREPYVLVDPERALGVQWEFVVFTA